jgi:uncharacterized protein (UPF0332 family)
MIQRGKQDLIQYRLSRARETLSEVRDLEKHGHWNGAISRLYYACYYAVSALLLQKDLQPKSHAGVRQLFGLHFVKKGLIAREFGKFYSDLYDLRQSGDYDDYTEFSKETLHDLLPDAEKLLESIENIVTSKC